MAESARLEVTFWGVRGSIPTPVRENLGFGGNTTCIAMRYGDEPLLIFDGGSGIRGLGHALAPKLRTEKLDLQLFMTHFHWDHIQGIPFFAPLYHPNCRMAFHSALPCERLQDILDAQMRPPYFPVEMPAAQAKCVYSQLDPEGLTAGGLRISHFPLHHPNGAHGYRVESPDAVVVFASDHEHGDAWHDENLRRVASGADVLIYDAQYTPEEYEHRHGWGHSTWLEATRVARDAGVKQLILFHHEPLHDDEKIKHIVGLAQAEFPNTSGAREGEVLFIGGS